jgi:hypothetical protein
VTEGRKRERKREREREKEKERETRENRSVSSPCPLNSSNEHGLPLTDRETRVQVAADDRGPGANDT